MTGWIIFAAVAAVIGGVLAWRGGFGRRGAAWIVATVTIAAAGYAWQGTPGLPGRPAISASSVRSGDSAFQLLRGTMMPRFGREADVLMTADAFERRGLDRYAVAILKAALAKDPRNADLWVGLAYALVLHEEGLLSPAAELAFSRARALQPRGPAVPFFRGLVLAQAGRFAEARGEWAALLAISPRRAPWYRDTELRIALMDALIRAQGGG